MPFKSIFEKDYTAYAYAKPGQYQKTIQQHQDKGLRLVRIVTAENFKGRSDPHIEEQVPAGYMVLLFAPDTAIPVEEMDLTGIIDNEGRQFIILDVETTGLQHTTDDGKPGSDRVIQLGMLKYSENGTFLNQFNFIFNPGFPIPPESTEVHGITDDFVKDAPIYGDKAEEIASIMQGCDIVAYNVDFDLCFLRQEFHRVAIAVPFDEPGTTFYDPLQVFRRQIPHTLTAAFHLYGCQGSFAPHGAVDDCMALAAVMKKQFLHANLGGDFKGLWGTFLHPYLDAGKHLMLDDQGKIVLAFGKYKGVRLFEMMKGHMDYVEWMMQEFSPDCVLILKENVAKFEEWKKKKAGK